MPDTELPEAQVSAESPAPAAVAELSPAACGARLAELFPALFALPRPLPLKLRIQADIQQRAPGIFSKRSLSGFLHRHTTSTAYLNALVHSAQRFDLDGVAAGELSAEHRDAAAAELARRRSVHDARRAAERAEMQRAQAAEFDARRARAALLRAFETTTLTPANFCALKGIAEVELDAQLVQARQEREQQPPPRQPERPQRPQGEHRGRRPAAAAGRR